MPRPFLRARWENLCIVTYPVSPGLLAPHVPRGLELDTRGGDAYVSLVAFDFAKTRVKGVAWPGFTAFPEVNLRFYVRRGEERGVCFLTEIVSSRVIACIAKWFYNEPYRVMKLRSEVRDGPEGLTVEHRLASGADSYLIAIAATPGGAALAPIDCDETFFCHHQWGFGNRGGGTFRFRVDHPRWLTYGVRSYTVDLDFARVYGEKWGVLGATRPCCVTLAAGSDVVVFGAEACDMLPAAVRVAAEDSEEQRGPVAVETETTWA